MDSFTLHTNIAFSEFQPTTLFQFQYSTFHFCCSIGKKANLTGSQALINVTVKYNVQMILCYTKITAYAEGTVVEFDK